MMAQQLTDYHLKNEYIDTSVQKAGIQNKPVCLWVIKQLIREAKGRGFLTVLWFDLTQHVRIHIMQAGGDSTWAHYM